MVIEKGSKLPRYPWNEWLCKKEEGGITCLVRGRDFSCQTFAMTVQIRAAAKRLNRKVSLHVDETASGSVIVVTIKGRIGTEMSVARPTRKATPKGNKKPSLLDAAAKVLREAHKPMSCSAIVEAVVAKKYWKLGVGKTPERTLDAAMRREINLKGKESRFAKTEERGKFTCR